MSNERARSIILNSPPNGGCLNVNHRLNHSLKKELQSHLQSVLSLHHGNLKLFVETTFKGFFSYLAPTGSQAEAESSPKF